MSSRLVALCIVSMLMGSLPLFAQTDGGTPLQDQLRAAVKRDALSVMMVSSVIGDLPFDGDAPIEPGFSMRASRVGIRGRLDNGFSYLLLTELVRSPALFGLVMSYQFHPAATVDVGIFKTPVSAEFMTTLARIPMVRRSQVSLRLARQRQLGMQLKGQLGGQGRLCRPESRQVGAGTALCYWAGFFNGTDINPNDNDKFMVLGRAGLVHTWRQGRLALMANGFATEDDGERFTGDRRVYGGDLLLYHGRWMAYAEGLMGSFDPVGPGPVQEPYGYQGTLGYMIVPRRHQVLARWDTYFPDSPAEEDTQFIVLGYTFWPISMYTFQLNYFIPMHADEPFSDQQSVSIKFQIDF